jgi:hypothetical protein
MTEAEEYFEERAEIMEYDGGPPRAEAERRAMEEMKIHLDLDRKA